MMMTMNTPSSSSSSRRRRSFGEELEPNTNRVIIDNTSLLLRLSAESSTETNHNNNNSHKDAVSSIADDVSAGTTSSQGSSVAHLRNLLDDFGKQQKQHYEKNKAVGQTPVDAQRPTRPKVGATKQAPHNKPTPLPPPAASALARRLVDTTTGLPTTRRHPRATPIRIQTKETVADVRATNEGYKSVKELSAWLADDPTKTKKKVKCLRRGANVIAKSRAFDKGLKDVIIEQDLGVHSVKGLVAAKKQLLATGASQSLDGNSSVNMATKANSHDWDETENVHAQAWPVPDTLDTASAISVSNKKQWLANAFKKAPGAADGAAVAPKAHTEVITAQDEREAVSNRAKHLWRQRSSKAKPLFTTSPPTFTQKSVAARKSLSMTHANKEKEVVVSRPSVETAETESTANSSTPEQTKQDATPEAASPTKYGFSAARDFLVQKSRQNGNPVDVHNIKNRTAKFEQLERHKSTQSTLHKTAWVETPQDDAASSSGRTFVRTVVPNTAPKKSMEELP
eukprot:scaffold1143_cov177-Amphora_coffeaeformis.AAC.1